MTRNSISSYFLVVSIMTFFVLFTFIVAKSYDNFVKSINTVQMNPLGKTIDLKLNTKVIDIIESRQKFPVDVNL